VNLTDLHRAIALSMIDGIGAKHAKNIIAYSGSLEEFFSKRSLKKLAVPGISNERLTQLDRKSALIAAEKEMTFILKNNIRAHFYLEQDYPRRLKECNDAPILLFSLGDIDPNPSRTIAVVGTRNASIYGQMIVEELISALGALNVQVVSGLAYGIDIMTHRSCLKHGVPTIGVLGHGLDRIYPAAHRNIARKMIESRGSGLLTEFPSGTNPDRENFPQRNRIVAGMTDATIVVESSEKGGSLITAYLANDYNRDVFAYPGNVFNPYSLGCNKLIASSRAHLINGSADLIRMMDWANKDSQAVQPSLFLDLPPEESRIVSFLQENPDTPIDLLALRLEQPISKLNSALLSLEIQGAIVCAPGKKYRAIPGVIVSESA
jgi:DNA processing protein